VIPVFLGLIYIFVRLSRARALTREKVAMEETAVEEQAIRRAEEIRRTKIRQQQEEEWVRRFQDINNFFPEIKDSDEKKRKVQDLRHKAYVFARDNDELPADFEEMTPEEQYLYNEAFKRKTEGTLEQGITRLTALMEERDRARQEELDRLSKDADARVEREERVRNLVATKPDDAVQVLRLWLED